LDTYFRDVKNFVTNHHLKSYDEFVEQKIKNIVHTLNPFDMIKFHEGTPTPSSRVRVYVGGKSRPELAIKFFPPSIKVGTIPTRPLYPNEARLKSLTYQSTIKADILVETETFDVNGKSIEKKEVTFPAVKIGAVPVMVGSMLCNLTALDARDKVRVAGECEFDHGGYFIVGGKEKVIIAQERNVTNVLFVSAIKDENEPYTYEAVIRSTPEEAAVFPKVVRFYVHRGKADNPAKRNRISVALPGLESSIPLFVLFRALGVSSDRSILEHILAETGIDNVENKGFVDFMFASIVDGAVVHTQTEAFEYIGARHSRLKSLKYDVRVVQHMLLHDVFPNMNERDEEGNDRMNARTKAMFLGHLLMTLLRVCLDMDKVTDRDHYAMKRVDVSGALCANIFRDFYNLFRRMCMDEMDRQYHYGLARQEGGVHRLINQDNLSRIFQYTIVEEKMINSLRGKWGVDEETNGVVQDLSRLSYMGSISHLRRVQSPLSSEVKLVAPHRLHASQYGIICPIESPDGANVGLIKNMALTCVVTPDMPGRVIREWMESLGPMYEPIAYVTPSSSSSSSCKIFINYNWVGCTKEPDVLVKKLRALRRSTVIEDVEYMSVAWDVVRRKIDVFTDAGRCGRPLFVVDNSRGDLALTDTMVEKLRRREMRWEEMFVSGAIEYIDVAESSTCLIATTSDDLATATVRLKRYTHCEIHPSSMFAVLSVNIPFANHNPATRGAFSCAQAKQAIGVYSTQFTNRMDTAGLVLHYAQRAVVGTRYMHHLRNNALPNGENAIVALMCYTGYNQEDSIIMNKASIERGMFNITYFKTIVAEENTDPQTGERVVFAHPGVLEKRDGVRVRGYGVRFGDYSKLDDNGFPRLNSKIAEHDAYIGKVLIRPQTNADVSLSSIKNDENDEVFKDKSEIADKTMGGMVDKVYAYGDDGDRRCKIRMRKMRLPTLGDKHASRHAQKGVVGMILPQAHMPFTKDGLVPDIIMNPHAFPSRMTVGHVMECILGKAGCMTGSFYDATPFSDAESNIDDAGDRLETLGYQRYGDEVMYNGITGEQMSCDVFVGPTYMLRLKHMVDDKINYRVAGDNGGYQAMTRQPVASRAKGGGLRIGEMESHSIIAHGMAGMLKESMVERSDGFMLGIDKTSGDIANAMSLGLEDRPVPENEPGVVGGKAIWFDKKRNFAMSDRNEFCAMQTTYTTKLFLQELRALGIDAKLQMGDIDGDGDGDGDDCDGGNDGDGDGDDGDGDGYDGDDGDEDA
jgi:DNA-directed RNA polymerase II subunit RPB2